MEVKSLAQGHDIIWWAELGLEHKLSCLTPHYCTSFCLSGWETGKGLVIDFARTSSCCCGLDEVSKWKLVHTVWALLIPVHSSAEFEPSSKFTPSRGYLPRLSDSYTCTGVIILGSDEDLQDSYGWEMLCKCKNNTHFLWWSLFTLDSLILLLLLLLLLVFPSTFPFVTNSALCRINCLLNGPIPIERQIRSKSILLLY